MIKPRIPVLNRINSLTRGLIFCAPFFEGGGTNLIDIASRSTGAFTNLTGGTWTSNTIGRGVTFNGTNGYINFGNNQIFNNLTNFSISVWVKFVTGAGSDRTIFSKNSNDTTCTFWFRFTADGRIRFVVASTSLNSTTFLTTNTIYNLTVTYDMVTMRIFINAKPDLTQANTAAPSVVATNAIIGAKTGGTGDFFNNDIYSVMLWNRTLNREDIKQLYVNPNQLYRQPKLFNFISSNASVVYNNIRMMMGMGT